MNASGKKFLNDARKAGREVFAWTVNDERLMKWSICQKIDGVCVDDIPRYFRYIYPNIIVQLIS